MDVSSPSPVQAVAAARIALAEAMVLKVGQTLQAVVLGKGGDGLTELKIGDQVLTAKLPQLLLPGTMLQLQVKAGGTTPQLVIVSQTPPGGALVARVATPAPAPNVTPLPAAVVPAANAVKVESAQQPAPVRSQTESLPVATPPTPPGTVVQPVEAGAALTPSTPDRPPATVAVTTTEANASTPVVANTVPPAQPSAPAAPLSVPFTTSPLPAVPVAASGSVVSPAPQQTAPIATVTAEPPAVALAVLTTTPGPQSVATAPSLPTATVQNEPAHSSIQPVVSALAAAAEPEPTAANPLLVAQAAARPQATMADLPRVAAAAITATGPVSTQLPPSTPQAALAQMLPEALAKQDSAAPLLAALAAAVERPNLLPEPILRAALGVLAQRIVVADGTLPAAMLEAAVAKSGVLLEANLAKAELQPGDAKAGLLALRSALARFLGETPVPAPRDAVRALHGQTDAAVSRIKLMQLASLPDADPARPSAPTLRMELPFLIGHELVMAQLQISRDGARREAERKRGWTMRFALNFSATGEVGAEVGLLGKAVNVALWAVEPATAEALNEALPELATALSAIGLNPGAMRIRQGVPEPERPPSGRLLDSTT